MVHCFHPVDPPIPSVGSPSAGLGLRRATAPFVVPFVVLPRVAVRRLLLLLVYDRDLRGLDVELVLVRLVHVVLDALGQREVVRGREALAVQRRRRQGNVFVRHRGPR